MWGAELSYDKGFGKAQLNGNIAGMKWKSARNDDMHAYGYQYDKLNRLTQADYRYNNAESNGWSNQNQDFTVFGIDYDLNGNILKLNRQGAIGKNTDGDWLFGAMDRLNYTYSGNRLLAVDDKAGTDASAGDFMDIDQLYCATNVDEYYYDANGSLTEDKNKGLSGMTYNRMNLPESVTTEEGEVHYGYDAAGIKLWKEVFENGALKKRTDYLGGLIITDNQIEFIPHEEGRFLPKEDGTYKTEFQYKDHLGNLRLAFREETATHTVTMEVENSEEEEERFDNVVETRLIGVPSHTGTAVSQLNGSNASRTMGPSTVFSVEKGDKINLSVFARYTNSGSFGTPNNFSLPNVGQGTSFGMEGTGFLGNGVGLNFNPLNDLLKPHSNVPSAYAVIHYLDGNGDLLEGESHEQFIQQGANIYQEISLNLEVENEEAKYAVVYLANQSPTNVYFDDLSIEHTRLVWQENAYYPFGMAIKPLDYEPEGSSRWKYNGGSEREEATGFDETPFRIGYDSQLGRFHQTDLLTELFSDMTGYHFAYNDPINYNDPTGLFGVDSKKKQRKYLRKKRREIRRANRKKRKSQIKKLNPLVDLGKTNSGEQLLHAVRYIHKDVKENGGSYHSDDIAKGQLSGGFGAFGSSFSNSNFGYRYIGGHKVNISINKYDGTKDSRNSRNIITKSNNLTRIGDMRILRTELINNPKKGKGVISGSQLRYQINYGNISFRSDYITVKSTSQIQKLNDFWKSMRDYMAGKSSTLKFTSENPYK